MDFTLKIMGSASAKPVVDRNQSAQVLSVHGRLFLIDAGEGVQTQLSRYHISHSKIDSIFISHIHGDHVFGIFGLLSTMGMLGRRQPVNIYAPSNFGPILKFFLSYYGEGLNFEIRFTALKSSGIAETFSSFDFKKTALPALDSEKTGSAEFRDSEFACPEKLSSAASGEKKWPKVIYETKSIEILAFPLNHGIETFAYMFREKMPQYNVHKWAIVKYGLSLTEIGSLKRGDDVIRPDSVVIKASEAAYIPFQPRSYAYCSDTAPFPELVTWLQGVSVLYHEATYLAEFAAEAARRHHSTTLDAARLAKACGAKRLLIGHYSSRFRDVSLFGRECCTIFPETTCVSDGDTFEISL